MNKPPRKKPAGPPKNQPFSDALRGLKEKLAEDEKAAKASPSPRAGHRPQARAAFKPPKIDAVEEATTFHRMMSGVLPLDAAGATRVPATSEEAPRRALTLEQARARAEAEAEAVHEHLRQLVDGSSRFEVNDDGRRVAGRRIDVPQDLLRSLRRGAITVEGRLDLHGKTESAAKAELLEFLRDRRARLERCVLVIHGKGDHSPGGKGVLRGEIAAWLAQGRASEHVGAFATAVDKDGGEGAVYVLLRK